MLDLFFCPRVVRRLQKARDADVLIGFVGYLHDRGHARNTVHQYVWAAEPFLCWLRRRRLSLDSIDETTVRSFACRRRSSQKSRHTIRAALHHLLRHLRSDGRTQVPAAPARTALGDLIADYDVHLDKTCGLSASTRLYRCRYAREFVQFVFASKPMDWRRVRPEHVHAFIARYGVQGRVAAARVGADSLRSFLRWLQFRGRVDARLLAAVPRFPAWRLISLPTVMSERQLDSFLAAFDRTRPSGRRDYAMALCMVDLGLRVAEVAGLRIDDLDAAAGTLRLSRGKSRRDRVLPMPRRVWQAVVAYVRQGRPMTDAPSLFVRHRAPFGAAVTRELIRGVMRRAYASVPGCEEWTGTHPLRHTAATRLHHAGADLKRVADILGHRSLDTTAIYTKVDFDQLAQVALPWPSGAEVRS